MDLDGGVLFAATKSVDVVERLRLAGVGPEDFVEASAKRAFTFIAKHLDSHGSLPEPQAVAELCQVEGLETFGDQGVSEDWLLEEFVNRKLHRALGERVEKIRDKLRANDPHGALESLQEFAAAPAATSSEPPVSLFSLGGEVEEAYRLVKEGFFGCPLPWPKINEITMGLWPGTCTYFVARPGTGKTHVAMLIARHAWQHGKRVLIVSPEMSKEAIAERFFIAQAQVSGVNLLRGTLTDFEQQRLHTTVEELENADGIWIVDSSHKLDGPGLDQYIRQLKPDLVCLDSIYDLSFQGNKTERTMAAIDWMRSSSKKHDVPFVGFHQINRSVGQKGKEGVGFADAGAAIALTDQLLWDAHAIFILEQSQDMLQDKRLRFHVGKKRRGHWDGEPIDCHWDFETMNFSEVAVGAERQQYNDQDAGFDEGVPF